MLNKLFALLILFITFSSFSQNIRLGFNDELGLLYFSREGIPTDVKEVNIQGSQYIEPMFESSKVYGYDGVTPLMRYNAFKDEMEFIESNKTYYLIKTDSTKLKLSSKIYKYLTYNDKNEKQNGYLVELLDSENSKFSAYKKEKIVLIPEYIPNSSYQESKPAHYQKQEDKFYLGILDKIVDMPSKRKDFSVLFPKEKERLEIYIKENKISFKNENDLIKLLKFMNTL